MGQLIERIKTTMAANPTAKNRATDQHARNITAYDLVIGILAIFSLVLLIPIYLSLIHI